MRIQIKRSEATRRLVMIGLFSAMAYVVMLVLHIKVSFLTLDVKDAVIILCGLYFGPVSALVISLLVPLLELITVSTTGAYGLIMNILGSVSFSVTASLIYKYKKTLWGAIVALCSGAFAMVAVMLLANLVITPYYMGVTADVVRDLIPTLLLPFNAVKAVLNVGIVLLFYKSLSRALRKTGFLPRKSSLTVEEKAADTVAAAPVGGKRLLTTVLVTVVAVLLITAATVLIFTVLGGKITFGVE